MTSEPEAVEPQSNPGVVDVGGKPYMVDGEGRLTPLELVKEPDKLQDQMVRRLFAAACEVEQVLGAFKAKAFDDIDAFNALLAERYGARAGGAKGNITLQTYDGSIRILVQVADRIDFGPELQQAKALADQCLEEWSSDSRPQIRKLVMDAFDVDKEGNINRGKLLSLLRLDNPDGDERWASAMQALTDSIKVTGTRRYIRVFSRERTDAPWKRVCLEAANA